MKTMVSREVVGSVIDVLRFEFYDNSVYFIRSAQGPQKKAAEEKVKSLLVIKRMQFNGLSEEEQEAKSKEGTKKLGGMCKTTMMRMATEEWVSIMSGRHPMYSKTCII